MNVDMFTRGDWIGLPAKARTQHQEDCAVLSFERSSERVTLFGPASAKEAFEQIAAIFNQSHPQPTREEIAAKEAEEDYPF